MIIVTIIRSVGRGSSSEDSHTSFQSPKGPDCRVTEACGTQQKTEGVSPQLHSCPYCNPTEHEWYRVGEPHCFSLSKRAGEAALVPRHRRSAGSPARPKDEVLLSAAAPPFAGWAPAL